MMTNKIRFACKYLLPLNREERFYSATVLPILLSTNNFDPLGKILEKHKYPRPNDCDLFQFFTEYSAFKSSHAKDVKMNEVRVERDTPDLVCVIKRKNILYVLIIEVKMYDKKNVRPDELNSQMQRQIKAIEAMLFREKKKKVCIKAIAVLPQILCNSMCGKLESISFEEVLKITPKTPDNTYYWEILDYALKVFQRKVNK